MSVTADLDHQECVEKMQFVEIHQVVTVVLVPLDTLAMHTKVVMISMNAPHNLEILVNVE